ncbi:MAG TPA: hypothetical protein VFU81_02950 [Thermomicrobiales bacterium]|nr:hypothetical protein [Thermomicrobiales bacterium]
MDGRRFDRWTRLFATRDSRRGALRALLGTMAGAAALGGLGRVQAQQAALPLGAACATADQCSQAGGPVACADNGLSHDGALNCCRYADGACPDDASCCAGLYCVNGVCASSQGTQAAVQAAVQPTVQAVNSGGAFALGAPCSDTSQCGASTAGPVVCGDSKVDRDRTSFCCLQDGGACGTTDAVCCGSLICAQGVCAAPQYGNQGPGDACQATTDCSQALGPAACDAAADGASRCCLLAATSCSADDECCGGLVCAENGIASDGGRNCCGNAGAACRSDASCCAYLFCIDGACGHIA